MRKTKHSNQEKNDIYFNKEKIEITEENLEAYEDFVFFTKNYRPGLTPFASKKEQISLYLFGIIGFLLSIGIGIAVAFIFSQNVILVSLGFMSMFPGFYATYKITNKIIRKMNMKAFQKQYPNFDLTTDTNEVISELEKYNELSKISETIEEEKEEHLEKMPNDFHNLSTSDKITFLNQEREFWEQVSIQEKYGNREEKQSQKVYHNQ